MDYDPCKRQHGPALTAFQRDMRLVSTVYDTPEEDPMAGLQVTTDGYRELATLIEVWAVEHTRGRTVWVLEGGYNLKALGDSVVACLELLIEDTTVGGHRVDSAGDRGYNSGSPD